MPALLIHIGAGKHSSLLDSKYRRLLKNALSQDFSTASITIEQSPLTNTGYGSSLDSVGNASCDCTVVTVRKGKVDGLLSLTNITDSTTPTRACQQVFAQLVKDYHPQSLKGQLGLLRPSVMDFKAARTLCKDIPMENLVLNRTKWLYSKYLEHGSKLEKLIQSGSFGEQTRQEDLQEVGANNTKEHKATLETFQDLSRDIIQDTVGIIEIDETIQMACSSGGNFLHPPGRISCAGIYGTGTGYGRSGSVQVVCLCSGNGDDIVKMGLGAHVSDRMAQLLLSVEEWPDLGTTLVGIVEHRSSMFQLEAIDSQLNRILYVGVVAVVKDSERQRVVFCHSTESFYFGFRGNGNVETVLSRHAGKVGTFVCGEYKM